VLRSHAAVNRWFTHMLSGAHVLSPVLLECSLSFYWTEFNLPPSSKLEGTDALMDNQPWGLFLASEICPRSGGQRPKDTSDTCMYRLISPCSQKTII
jgi:hypothetical protein